ncbi:phosphate ABC transporter permease PstA [Ruminiclostridium cellobioparum]|jgi:phosphate transport system permease protein|uniref:Phosphate transport system permease protein PstA n=1 Tax=Ruminiclostridium cellobioparum subsp. termitidis CT1112 TaxID=1195236 RepID=S0FYH7_RUMCE|nr:phosphate ABC transporter permease PstA [Ruminiclostridium cellobioparum]EMS73653.1 phosphate ABC transporter, permease protein PstA [Ruminiclostridium cellobioparum subsp. termitidis CT1112]
MKSKTADKLATVVFYIIATGFILLLMLFVGYIIYQGRDRLNLHFITSAPTFMKEGGGIGPQLFNSLYLVFLSMLITVPIGLSAGIYLAEYAKPGRITNMVRFCIEALASLPSIVIGLFGLLVFVTMTGWGYTLFSGALAVAVLNLPVITRISEDAIRNVPQTVKEASLALGATHWQTIYRVILPTALPGLVTGLIMTSGRVFGEAAALLYTAGMSSPNLNFHDLNPFHARSPLNPFRPAETLAVYIWKVNSEGLAPDSRQIADGASSILIISVFLFNIISRFLGRVLNVRFSGSKN